MRAAPKAQLRPESLRQKDRGGNQRLLRLQPWIDSGERPTRLFLRVAHRRGSSSQVTGQRGDGRMAVALLFVAGESMGHRTPLYDAHVSLGAKLVDFGGWDMPLHYGSQIEEHHQVRRDAGMFDVSHMVVSDLKGGATRDFLKLLLANNVDKLKTRGRALYTCMLNSKGGVIDDLIVYYMDDDWFRIVSNAATHDKDLAWIQTAVREFGRSRHPASRDTSASLHVGAVTLTERADLAMIAVQGPNAKEKVYRALGENLRAAAGPLKPFHAATIGELMIATTGYTGEDGFEIILLAKAATFTWQMLREAGGRALWSRRARYAAARGRHGSLWRRHGRDHDAA